MHRRASSLLLLLASIALPVGSATGTGSQTLSAAIEPVATVTVVVAANLMRGVNPFSPFTGAATINYKARTTPTGGGAMTLQVTSDFTPSGGPTAAGNSLTYTCSGATLGTACSGTQTASTTSQTPVLTLPASACTGGGGACSGQDPNSVSVSFSLTDDPRYPTGSYSAQLTFTISAT